MEPLTTAPPMRRASTTKSSPVQADAGFRLRGSREAALIALSSIAVYLVISLATYHSGDPGWAHSGHVGQIHNQGGRVGAWIADVL